jgi:hypothetical protein
MHSMGVERADAPSVSGAAPWSERNSASFSGLHVAPAALPTARSAGTGRQVARLALLRLFSSLSFTDVTGTTDTVQLNDLARPRGSGPERPMARERLQSPVLTLSLGP